MCVAFEGNLDELADAKAHRNAIAAQTARQVSWVKRKAEGRTSWRPKKRHRLSACHWCVNVDNQIRQSLGLRGFADFIPAKDVHWKKKRHLNIAIDKGFDGLCAGNWLLHMGVPLTLWMDVSHGATNDITATMKALGLWSFLLLMLVTLNMEHGPWDCDTRYAQVGSQ